MASPTTLPAPTSAALDSASTPTPAPAGEKLEKAWNEYLLWLSFAVPGMLNKGNVDAMSYALARLPKETSMIEIGSFCGLSTCVLTHLRERLGITAPFFTSDRWIFEGQQLGQRLGESRTVTHDAYQAFTRASFLRNMQMFCANDLPKTIERLSDDFFAGWAKRESTTDVFGRPAQLGGPIGFAYIDGNHTYEFAARDFANTDTYLVSGGYILFDDSADGSTWEVCRVVKEVLESGRYELVAKVPNYLVRKR